MMHVCIKAHNLVRPRWNFFFVVDGKYECPFSVQTTRFIWTLEP